MQALLPDLELEPLPPEEDPYRATRPRKRNFALFVHIAGLVAGSWVFFVSAMAGTPNRFTWAGLLGHGLRYAFLTWAWSAGITFLLYLTIPTAEQCDVAWNTLRVSAAAVWFAPAILLLSEWSPSTMAAGLVLTVSATRMLYSQWRVMNPPPPEIDLRAREGVVAGVYRPWPGTNREIVPVLVAACLVQLGAAEAGMNKRLLSSVLLVAGCSLLAIQAVSRGAWSEQRPASLPRSFLGALFTILLAASLTVTGMRGHVVPGGLTGGNSPVTLREILRQFFGRDQPTGESDSELASKKKGTGNSERTLPKPDPTAPQQAFGGSFPGVILRPETEPIVTLVAPPTAVKHGYPTGSPARPFSIPFSGEYWMFRWTPYITRPPINSFRQQGTPAELSFRTVDHWPLEMEARQELPQPIDLACCSAVQVEIRNADSVPGAVLLELFAIGDHGMQQSLGLAPINSRPITSKEPIEAVGETLEFHVPANLTIGMAQEFKIVFGRMRAEAHRSARIAIGRFLLVPRG